MWCKSSKGNALIENGILLALVAIVAVGVLAAFGGNIHTMIFKSNQNFKGYKPMGVATADEAAVEITVNDIDPNEIVDPIPPGNIDDAIISPPGDENSLTEEE